MANFESTIPATALPSVLNLANGKVVIGDGQMFLKRIPIAAGATGEVDSGWDLPEDSIVHGVFVKVDTAQSSTTLDVGLLSTESGGDADGFLDGVSGASTGVRQGQFVATVGSNNSYLGAAAAHTNGVLLTGLLIAGEDTAAGGDGVGVRGIHVTESIAARSVSYTRGGATFSTFVGEIWIMYSILASI